MMGGRAARPCTLGMSADLPAYVAAVIKENAETDRTRRRRNETCATT